MSYTYKLADPYQDKELIKERLSSYISDADIEKYLDKEGLDNIIKYSDLKNYNNIDELIPEDEGYKIILIENELNKGHWVVLLKYQIENENSPTIEWFNSYGLRPSVDLNFISYYTNKLLGQGYDDLNNILDNAVSKYNIIYNKKRFQANIPNINTCGRWALNRIIMFKHFKMDLYEYINFIEQLQKEYNYPTDVILAMLMP
jgi:hypothetical protein